jgi:hypothetical protein
MGTRYVLADFGLLPMDIRAFYSLGTRDVNCTLSAGWFLTKGNLNIDPLNPKKKGDIYLDVTHLGDGKLRITGNSLGVDLNWFFPSGGKLDGQLSFSKGDLSSSALISTPVMGRGLSSLFIPIVHRAEGEVSGSAFSQLYGLHFRISLSRVLEIDCLARLIYTTVKLNGRIDYDFYGIKVPSWSEDTTYRGAKLITVGSTIRYRLGSRSDISLGISQHIPIKPKKEARVPPGPPKPKKIGRMSRGGMSLQMKLRYDL